MSSGVISGIVIVFGYYKFLILPDVSLACVWWSILSDYCDCILIFGIAGSLFWLIFKGL